MTLTTQQIDEAIGVLSRTAIDLMMQRNRKISIFCGSGNLHKIDRIISDMSSAYWKIEVENLEREITSLHKAMEALQLAKENVWQTIEDWHEEIGDCFWTKFPVEEPYYTGSPLDCDWVNNYYTHFIPTSALPTQPPQEGE